MQVEESGVNSILIKDAFDKSWRRVGLALENLQLLVDDKDRSKGIYYLKPISAGGRVQMPKDGSDPLGAYRVTVSDAGLNCRVTVSASDGMRDAGSKVLLDALYSNIQP
jgi:outer membrane protein assembly factor BamC